MGAPAASSVSAPVEIQGEAVVDDTSSHGGSEPGPAFGVSETAVPFTPKGSVHPGPVTLNVTDSQNLNSAVFPREAGAQTLREGESGGSPFSRQSLDKITTRKRDRSEVDSRKGLFQNLSAAFSLESPRPFKRVLRPIAEAEPSTPWDIGTPGLVVSDGPFENSFLQHSRSGLSPSTSERSSGEPVGSA